MKTLLVELKISLLLTLLFCILLCGAYPAAVWAGAQALFPAKANGSLLLGKDGVVLGSTLLAQNFASDKYFQPRASAAGTGYDATSSSGTNFGPTSQKLNDSIKAAVAAYRTSNSLAADAPVPADAVTSSCSGLDPHISVDNALLQSARVAKARGIAVETVRQAVAANTDGRDLGIFGEAGVNVLRLNVALDKAGGGQSAAPK
jgi:K+-transporting ATPase ATPase C chain